MLGGFGLIKTPPFLTVTVPEACSAQNRSNIALQKIFGKKTCLEVVRYGSELNCFQLSAEDNIAPIITRPTTGPKSIDMLI